MTDIIWIIAVLWLAVSNIYLTYSLVKAKVLEKSKDLYEFKHATEKKKEKTEDTWGSDFIPLYNEN
jgi:hypothetical protein